MSRERLPFIGSSGRKAAKAPHTSPALQHPHQTSRRKQNQQQQQQQQQAASSSHPHPGPPSSVLLSNSTMTPWGGLALSESSFTSIPTAIPLRPPALPPPPPPPPPAPQPTPATPYHDRQEEDEDSSSSSFNSEVPSPPLTVPQSTTAAMGKGFRNRKKVLPQRRLPRPPRLPPLRPVTNLSFSRSFTFSFFELPLHQSPRCRAERVKNLLLLLRQIHY